MPSAPRILLTHTPEARGLYYGARALSGLRALGEVELQEGAEPLDAAALIAAARSCRIIVAVRATACPAELFAALPELVSVSRVAIDIRNIDVEAASAHGVLVTKASRSWVAAVSELAIGLMIDVARGVSRVDAACKAGKAQLALMQPHAYLVNLSRGNLVDEAALEAALDEKRIAGAALDVGRAPDQMPSPRLARRADVVATPHMGGLTPAAIEGQALETVAQVGEIVRGLAPEGSVNAERAQRLSRFG